MLREPNGTAREPADEASAPQDWKSARHGPEGDRGRDGGALL